MQETSQKSHDFYIDAADGAGEDFWADTLSWWDFWSTSKLIIFLTFNLLLHCIDAFVREELAQKVGLTESRVQGKFFVLILQFIILTDLILCINLVWFQNRRAKFRRNERSASSARSSVVSSSTIMPTSPQKPHISHEKSIHQFDFPPPYPPLGFTSLGSMFQSAASTNTAVKPNEHYTNTFSPYQYQQNYNSYCANNFNRYKSPYWELHSIFLLQQLYCFKL